MGSSPSPWEIVFAARRFHHLLQARLDRALNGFSMSYAQYEILELLHAEPKLHAGELGRRLGVTRQTAHGLLVQLDRAGLVQILPQDGAYRGAWLTRSGRRRVELCRQALGDLERALRALPAGRCRDLLEAFATVEAQVAQRTAPWWMV